MLWHYKIIITNQGLSPILAKAYQKAHGHFKRRLQGHGLTPVQHLIPESLWEEEGFSSGDIGKKLMLDSATLSDILERMAEKGWIVKETDDVDKRFIRIHPAVVLERQWTKNILESLVMS